MHLRHTSIQHNNFFIRVIRLLFSAVLYIGPFSLSAQSVLQKIYVDFGPNDITNGNSTIGSDVNGNYWNNVTNPVANAYFHFR